MRDSVGVVAILFTDLVGSTEVLDRLGDDAAEDLRRTHFALLRQAVADADGTEVKSLGDGLMVTFASPVQAVACAVAMQQAIAEHNRTESDRPLEVRVGLHAGDPVRHEDDLHGTAVVVAKRLCDQAEGGQILASNLVAGLVGTRGGFRFRSVGRRKLKGLAEPMPTVTVEWRESATPPAGLERSARQGRSHASPPRQPARPLVARSQELGRLAEALTQAEAGRGQIVFVVGEMGIGKTRLVEEGLALARSQGFVALVGRTPAAGSGLAYAPLLAAFGSVLRSLEAPERDDLLGDLPHLGRLWPEFGLPPPALVGDADLERALLYEAVARLLERLCFNAPVVLFVDDLHWADTASLALLGYLVPTVAASPVTLIVAYRPERALENKVLRQFVTNARRSGVVSELPLRGLDPNGVAELAAGILGDEPPASILELSARAAGTPLFVEALIRGMLDTGALVRSEDGWTLAADRASALPSNVQDLVVDRLDLLAADERSLLELIAHGIQGLPHDLLERAGDHDSDKLLDAIRRLTDAGLVVQDDEGPEVIYRLAHPLLREVTQAEVPAVAGRRLHARLAAVVEELRPGDLDRLAYHYSRAGREVDGARALEVLLEAGERAQGLAAHDEAARHFAAALPLIRDSKRPDLLAHVLEQLGQSWEPLGETAAAMEVWTEAVSELERAGDVRSVARLRRRLAYTAHATGDIAAASRHLDAGIATLREMPASEELADLNAARFLIGVSLNDPERAHEAVASLTSLADTLGLPRVRAEALLSAFAIIWMAHYTGPIDGFAALAEEARRVAVEGGEWGLARRAHRELGHLAIVLGDHATVKKHAQAQSDIDQRLGDIAHQSGPIQHLGFAELLAGDFPAALTLAEQAVALARRYDQRRTAAQCLGLVGHVRVLMGDLEQAHDILVEARQFLPPAGTDRRADIFVAWPSAVLALELGDAARVRENIGTWRPPISRSVLAAAQVLDGDLAAALATADALAADGPAGSYPAAVADRVRGLVEYAHEETDAGRELLSRSVATMDALELPFEAAVSRLALGTVESLREALAAFEALGAARYADRARRALRSLGVRVPSARSGRSSDQPISRREMEVARLVAQGLSNAEIAERLVLSVRTIESHLDHVYARLGLSSRAALAGWVTANQKATAQ